VCTHPTRIQRPVGGGDAPRNVREVADAAKIDVRGPPSRLPESHRVGNEQARLAVPSRRGQSDADPIAGTSRKRVEFDLPVDQQVGGDRAFKPKRGALETPSPPQPCTGAPYNGVRSYRTSAFPAASMQTLVDCQEGDAFGTSRGAAVSC